MDHRTDWRGRASALGFTWHVRGSSEPAPVRGQEPPAVSRFHPPLARPRRVDRGRRSDDIDPLLDPPARPVTGVPFDAEPVTACRRRLRPAPRASRRPWTDADLARVCKIVSGVGPPHPRRSTLHAFALRRDILAAADRCRHVPLMTRRVRQSNGRDAIHDSGRLEGRAIAREADADAQFRLPKAEGGLRKTRSWLCSISAAMAGSIQQNLERQEKKFEIPAGKKPQDVDQDGEDQARRRTKRSTRTSRARYLKKFRRPFDPNAKVTKMPNYRQLYVVFEGKAARSVLYSMYAGRPGQDRREAQEGVRGVGEELQVTGIAFSRQ